MCGACLVLGRRDCLTKAARAAAAQAQVDRLPDRTTRMRPTSIHLTMIQKKRVVPVLHRPGRLGRVRPPLHVDQALAAIQVPRPNESRAILEGARSLGSMRIRLHIGHGHPNRRSRGVRCRDSRYSPSDHLLIRTTHENSSFLTAAMAPHQIPIGARGDLDPGRPGQPGFMDLFAGGRIGLASGFRTSSTTLVACTLGRRSSFTALGGPGLVPVRGRTRSTGHGLHQWPERHPPHVGDNAVWRSEVGGDSSSLDATRTMAHGQWSS